MSLTPDSQAVQHTKAKPVQFYVEVASENSLIIYFGVSNASQQVQITPTLCAAITKAQALIRSSLGALVVDTIPSYASLLITYDIWKVDHFHILTQLENLLNGVYLDQQESGRTITLPVYYHTSVGPDLQRIADHQGISVEDVIELHQQQDYYVYTIGFAPGFAYLGEVSDKIAMPRLATPRAAVARGSVAIADKQTAVYPQTSPGGWNIIGRCPIPMFNPAQQPPIPVAVGDKVRFNAIGEKQFLALGGKI
ncbi:5-oxoprolinase subunit PxpB [Thalassotalea mangrovi]|uniref:5-oxoprolinase subunit PxpB n=1 Tax=Thalassotalea mangrovi TaxID=2572245 RepID=A0A4U1B357_9GAMM|nr:5-oxoprolinase subunit PxpB [Thalassotalea mangrovi]TKB44084.1 5-oxoprolinase subunit PxpB [Thalassotalea mangrovi]